MPDVGVLNLQIHDDSAKAAQGLNQLVGVLNRVKEAVDFGGQLGTIAKNLANLSEAVDKGIQGTTIAKLKEITSSLEKLKNIGTINIKINYGKNGNISSATEIIESTKAGTQAITENTQAAAEAAAGIGNGFEEAGARVDKFNVSTESAARRIENLKDEFGRIDLNKELDISKVPLNAFGMKMEDSSKEFLQYGEIVKDSFESIRSGVEEKLGEKLADNGIKAEIQSTAEAVSSATSQMAEGFDSVGRSVKEVSTAPINDQIEHTREELEELRQQTIEMNRMRDEARLSQSYSTYRELAMSGEGDWMEQAQRIYGLTQNAIEQCDTYAEALKFTMEEVNQYVDQFIDKTNQPAGPLLRDAIDTSFMDQLSMKSAEESAEAFKNMDWTDTFSEAAQSVQTFTQSQAEAKNSSKDLQYSLVELDKEVKHKKTDFNTASEGAKKFRGMLMNLKEGANSLISPLVSLGRQFANIARRMAIRAVIRQFTSAITEGVENVYQYSKAVGGSFAPSMDSAATALAQMKNSVGAALAPAIEALIPVLNTLVNWFIVAINYVNQFFSLLRGQTTWLRALEVSTKAYDKSTKQAQKTAKAAKELLADWDELNIIQSQGGSGGTGGAFTPPTDYAKMFEEVGEYAKWVKDLVSAIKEQFGDVLTLVKKIGIALLGWALASSFTEVLGTIGGLIAGGAVIDLVFNVVEMFDKQFLKTGDIGWLLGDILTTLVGAFFMSKIFNTVLGSGTGTVGVALTFAVSAAATIAANIKETDVSALSKESVINSVLAALKGGAATAFLAYSVTHSVAAAGAGAGIGALATFGIAMTLKACAQIDAEGITQENVIAEIEGIASLGIAGAATGAYVGHSAAAAAGMSMLFSGAAITTFGVAIGISAINTTAEAGEITKDVIEQNLLSATVVGAGLALVAGSTIGSGLAIAIAGVGGAALTVGILFGLEATIADSVSKVEWGSYDATKEEIEEYVNKRLYEEPPTATVSLIEATLEPSVKLKENLTKSAETMLGTIYAARIGVATTPEELSTQIDQVLSDFNASTEQYQKTLSVALNLVPTQRGGENGSSKIIESSGLRWKELNDTMKKMGQDLADAYKIAYDARLNGNIDENAEFTIRKISEMMSRVTSAITNGQMKAQAVTAIRDQMGNLSKETMDGILKTYEEQRDKLIEEMTKIREESAEGLLSQQYAYEELMKYALEDAGGDTTDETYQHYKDLAEQAKNDYVALLATLKDDVEKAANELVNEEAGKELAESLLSFIVKPMDPSNVRNLLSDAGYGVTEGWTQALAGALRADSADMKDAIANEQFNSMFENLLMGLVGLDNFDTYKHAIDLGILKWSDLFNEEVMNALKTELLGPDYSEELGKLWDDKVSELFGYKKTEVETEVEVKTKVNVDKESQGMDVKEELLRGLPDKIDLSKIGEYFSQASYGDFDMISEFVKNLLKDSDVDYANEQMQTMFENFLYKFVGSENFDTYKGAIDEGLLKWSDIFNKEVIDALKVAMLGPEYSEDLGKLWDERMKGLFGYTDEFKPNLDAFEEYQQKLEDQKKTMDETVKNINNLKPEPPKLDTKDMQNNAGDAATSVEDMATRIRNAFQSLNGLSFSFNAGNQILSGIISAFIPPIPHAANGGIFKSGDVFSANENGNIELIGGYGNRTAVVNNDQVVGAVTNGVAQANSGVESRLGTIETLLNLILQKEFTAKAVPSASWGQHAARSADAFSKVTG